MPRAQQVIMELWVLQALRALVLQVQRELPVRRVLPVQVAVPQGQQAQQVQPAIPVLAVVQQAHPVHRG